MSTGDDWIFETMHRLARISVQQGRYALAEDLAALYMAHGSRDGRQGTYDAIMASVFEALAERTGAAMDVTDMSVSGARPCKAPYETHQG